VNFSFVRLGGLSLAILASSSFQQDGKLSDYDSEDAQSYRSRTSKASNGPTLVRTEAGYKVRKRLDAVSRENLFQNTNLSQGNPNNLLVPNDALDAVGLTSWVAQQTGLNPFVSVQRGLNANGRYTLRMINGVPSATPHTVSTGPYTFNLATGLNFVPGINVRVVAAEDPRHKWMDGIVVSYNSNTGALSLSITAHGPVGGTSKNWYIGRNGTTTMSTPVYNMVTANVATGSTVIPLANTSTIEIGANVEQAAANGIGKATYVVGKTANSITISKPTNEAIAAGYRMTTYGDQGWFLYQNLAPEHAYSFRHGTPNARTSYLTFRVRSHHISGTASIMALGYSSLYTLGRSYAAPFAVSEQEQVVTVPIYGDTAATPGTWQPGYDGGKHPYMAVGFSWVARDTKTSRNIAPYKWSNTFAVAGAKGQTLDLASVVGAWVELSEVRYSFARVR
jgi:hypothetical protein